MNILHISSKPAWPEIDGGCVAIAALLRDLSELAMVSHFTVSTTKHPFIAKAYKKDVRLANVQHAFIDTSVKVSGAVKALLTGKNYNLIRFYNFGVSQEIKQLIDSEEPEVLVFDGLFAAVYLGDIRNYFQGKIIVRTHNVEHEIWEQQADNGGFFRRMYLRSLAKSLKQTELSILANADEVWCISTEDEIRFRSLGIRPTALIPVSLNTSERSSEPEACFFHLGSMNWTPNKQSVDFLLRHVWPQLPKEFQLYIAGSFSDKTDYSMPNVHGVGKVEDVTRFMQSHGILVAPITTGSGIRIKLLEALACGTPVLTTQLGASGLPKNGTGIIVAELADFVSQIVRLQSDRALRNRLSEEGLAYMGAEHSSEKVSSLIKARLEN